MYVFAKMYLKLAEKTPGQHVKIIYFVLHYFCISNYQQ